ATAHPTGALCRRSNGCWHRVPWLRLDSPYSGNLPDRRARTSLASAIDPWHGIGFTLERAHFAIPAPRTDQSNRMCSAILGRWLAVRNHFGKHERTYSVGRITY